MTESLREIKFGVWSNQNIRYAPDEQKSRALLKDIEQGITDNYDFPDKDELARKYRLTYRSIRRAYALWAASMVRRLRIKTGCSLLAAKGFVALSNKCAIDLCTNGREHGQLCSQHYSRSSRHGDPYLILVKASCSVCCAPNQENKPLTKLRNYVVCSPACALYLAIMGNGLCSIPHVPNPRYWLHDLPPRDKQPGACDILKSHAVTVADDPEALSTDYIADLIGLDCDIPEVKSKEEIRAELRAELEASPSKPPVAPPHPRGEDDH